MPESDDSILQQRWIAERYAANARFVAELAEPLIDLLDPRPGEQILDLGCGDGALTEKIITTGARVVAVDAAPDQIEAAAARGLDARVMNGEALEFDAEFDGILSNAALHWMSGNPGAVIDGMWRALRPGGRVVAEMGAAGNIAKISAAIIDAMGTRGVDGRMYFPWYFPAATEYRERLEGRGFDVQWIETIPRPTRLPGDISGWLMTFAEGFLRAFPEKAWPEIIDDVRERLLPDLYNEGVWTADYVRLRFCAVKGDG